MPERTLERRLFRWTLGLTLIPTLVLLAAAGWLLAKSLDLAGALGPWEDVAESGRVVVESVEPGADTALAAALDRHRVALSASLTQARRWAFLGERFTRALPWLVFGIAVLLIALALEAGRRIAKQLARPIRGLVTVAEHLGREEPLPEAPRHRIREVRVLDDALRAAAAQLRAARERALAAERVRTWGEMARRIAHEMKNPLTPLRLAAHRLGRSADPAVAEVVEVIGQEVGRLEEMAAQFGALGRPPEGPATDIDVPELIESLLHSDVPPEVSVDLKADTVEPVRGHYDSLLRAFRNLIRNALEAMEDADERRLAIAVSRLTDAAGVPWLEVRVRDTGRGLPPDGVDRIFDPDFSTKTRGTGLGLALVRQAVEADGGTVAASSPDRGAEFTVRLPARGPAAGHARERREHAVRGT